MNKKNLTEGIIWKKVLVFFIPIIIGAIFQHFYRIVDTIVVGRGLGELELASVGGSASKIIVMITNFFIGVSVGITSYTSRYFGEKNTNKLQETIVNGLLLFSVLGAIIAVITIVFSTNVMNLLGTPADTLEIAKIYLNTYLSGIVFCVIYNTLAGIMRAMGDAKTPLYVLIFCSVINIVLDILFALVMGYGVFGVALATVVSQGISAIILTFVILKSWNFSIKPKVDLNAMKDLCKVGIPTGVQSIMFSVSNMAVQSVVNTFTTLEVAAWVAYVNLDSVVDVFVSSLGATVIPFVGQNLGAKKLDRVASSVKQIMIMSFISTITLVGVFIVFRDPLLSLFVNNAEIVAIGCGLIFIVMPMHILAIPNQIYSQALRGLGISFTPMILTLVGVIGFRLFWVIFVVPINPSLKLLAMCYPISACIMSIIFTVYYKIEFKKIKQNIV